MKNYEKYWGWKFLTTLYKSNEAWTVLTDCAMKDEEELHSPSNFLNYIEILTSIPNIIYYLL